MESRKIELMTLLKGQQRRHRHFGPRAGRRSRMIWENSSETYTLPCVRQTDNGRVPREPRARALGQHGRGRGGGSGIEEGGDTRVPNADSPRSMAKTITQWSSNYPLIKKKECRQQATVTDKGIYISNRNRTHSLVLSDTSKYCFCSSLHQHYSQQ